MYEPLVASRWIRFIIGYGGGADRAGFRLGWLNHFYYDEGITNQGLQPPNSATPTQPAYVRVF